MPKLTIEEMQSLAKKRGGKCLSKRYVNVHSKLKWECSEGHTWKAAPNHVKSDGSWCPDCAGLRRLTIQEMRSIANDRGGQCLSRRYVDANTTLKWECARGHRWMATPSHIKNDGSWCPTCSSGMAERICRTYCRQLFGKPFPKSRPKWLKNSRGNQMELDGYCKDLSIAFEHQGEQHYMVKSLYMGSEEQLLRRQKDDDEKARLCKRNGVRLLVIPALFLRTALEDLQQWLFDECIRLRVRRPAGMLTREVKLQAAWKTTFAASALNELQSIAESQGGRCRSKGYTHSDIKLDWECAEGHRWSSVPRHVKMGSWCPECAGLKRLTIELMQCIAKEHGGKCLSQEYVNQNIKLQWECASGHRWKAKPAHIKNANSWCPECAGNRRGTIQEMQSLASKRGGDCLSKRYVNSQTKIRWSCSRGHTWMATPSNVKNRGSWCPKCAHAHD